jgi:hypothetical protein
LETRNEKHTTGLSHVPSKILQKEAKMAAVIYVAVGIFGLFFAALSLSGLENEQ